MDKKYIKKLLSKSDWNVETIEAFSNVIDRISKEHLGLDVYPNQFEIVSSEQLLDSYALIGLPISYNHWKFGKEYIVNNNNYKKGRMGLSYEMVINSNPCISYNLEDNDTCLMTLVYAHVQGHNHFFKNNYLFKQWTNADSIIDYMIFARNYISKCEEKYGYDEVEYVLDSCHALMDYGVDKYKKPKKLKPSDELKRLKEKLEDERVSLNEVWRKTVPNNEEGKNKKVNRFPLQPEENILYFIEKNSPKLKGWQREIVRIVRKIAQYFYPQGQCLVGDTYIYTKNGMKRIDNLIKDDGYNEMEYPVLSLNNKFETTSHFYKKKTNKTIVIKTKLGKTIECTPEHPLLSIDSDLSFNMVKSENLKIGDFIVNKIGYDNSFSKTAFEINLEFKECKEFVKCGICDKKYKNLSTHILKHGISIEEYKSEYSDEIISEQVLYNRSGDVKIPKFVNGNIARLLGYYISEGSWSHSFSIFNKDENIINDIENIFNLEFNISPAKQFLKEKNAWVISTYNTKFFEILEYLGIDRSLSYFKEVPNSILESPKDVVKDFLRALFEGGGCNTKSGQIQYSTRSKELSKQIQLLLQNFGIVSKVVEYDIDYNYKIDVPHKTNFKLVVLGHFYNKYMSDIGFLSDQKNEYKNNNNSSLNTYGVPYLKEILEKIRNSIDPVTSKNKIIRREGLPKSRSIESFKWKDIENQLDKFELIGEIDENIYLNILNAINSENYYDEIVSIELCNDERYVYDFTIPSNHLFLSDGYISHNTKVQNEGFASFVHFEIINKMFDEGYLDDGFMMNFLHNHSSVIYQPDFDSKYYSGINPYTLGFNIFTDIKRMSLDPTEEDKEWFPDIAGKGDWKEQFLYIVENFKDETFILQYLSPKVIRDMRLFEITDKINNSYYKVSSIHNESGYKKIRKSLSQNYNRNRYVPDIQVYNVNLNGDRKLTLQYTPIDNKQLDKNSIKNVLPHIEYLWGFDVEIVEKTNGKIKIVL